MKNPSPDPLVNRPCIPLPEPKNNHSDIANISYCFLLEEEIYDNSVASSF